MRKKRKEKKRKEFVLPDRKRKLPQMCLTSTGKREQNREWIACAVL